MAYKVDSELKDAVSQISSIMEQSERVAKISLDAIKTIDTNIANAKQKMDRFFTHMDQKQFKLKNLENSIKSLDDLYKFLQTLDQDEAYIQHGPQGSLEEYIKRLENLKTFHKYNQTDNYLFKTRMRKLNVLLVEGERILMEEFKNLIKHYSSQETITSFVNYLINIVDFNQLSLSNNDQPNFFLFIPKETIHKLQIICTWFLVKEADSELYNEKHQHCDVIEKLKYVDIRFEFIKLIIKYYLKLNNCESTSSSSSVTTTTSFGSQSIPSHSSQSISTLSSSQSYSSQQSLYSGSTLSLPYVSNSNSLAKLNKFLHSNSDTISIGSSNQSPTLPRTPVMNSKNRTRTNTDNDLLSNYNPNGLQQQLSLQPQQQQQNSFFNQIRKPSPNNLTSLMIEESNKLLLSKHNKNQQHQTDAKSRSLECIELFNDNLNFCLKLLQHEKVIINYIFKNSYETCNELLANLAILIIDEIQSELTVFLTQNIDFKKVSNNGPHVVQSIINLVVKVDMLKKNTHGLQLDNMQSASRLFHFSNSLNQITSQVLYFYLDTIKTGYFNHYQFPSDCSIHGFCESTCEIVRAIKLKEKVLETAMHLLCENFIDKTYLDDQNPSARGGDSGESSTKGRYRLKSNSYNESEKKLDFAKYFWLIIKRLNTFLIDEAIKSSTTTTAAITNVSSTKNGIINLKAYVFLLNNLEYILDCAAELNLIDLFRTINNNFDNFINESIQKNCEKACDIFQDINLKWKTVVKQTESNQLMLEALNSNRPGNNASSNGTDSLPTQIQAEMNEQQQFLNNLSKIQNASSVAKKAFKSFKSAVLKPRSLSDEFITSDSDDNADSSAKDADDNDLNLLRVTKLGSISSQNSNHNNDVTLLTVTRNISELKKRRLTLIQQLTTGIELSTKIVVINPTLNSRIKEMVREYLNPVLDNLEQTGEIRGIVRKIFVHNNLSNKKTSLKDQIFDEMFPNYKL